MGYKLSGGRILSGQSRAAKRQPYMRTKRWYQKVAGAIQRAPWRGFPALTPYWDFTDQTMRARLDAADQSDALDCNVCTPSILWHVNPKISAWEDRWIICMNLWRNVNNRRRGKHVKLYLHRVCASVADFADLPCFPHQVELQVKVHQMVEQ